MRFKVVGESERLVLSLLVLFATYYAVNTAALFLADGKKSDSEFMHYTMSLSFVLGILAGAIFYLASAPKSSPEVLTKEKCVSILKKALSKDEAMLLDSINGSEGITQDSLRFRTGFSKPKVSIIISRLEKSGIIAREKLGKTYRLYINGLDKEEGKAKEA